MRVCLSSLSTVAAGPSSSGALPATRSAKRRLEFLCDAVDLLDFFHEAPEPDFLPEEPARQGPALLGDADDAQREARERRDDQDERCPLSLRQTVKEAHERYRASEQGEQHLIFGLEERHDERDEEQPRFSPRDFQALQRAGRQQPGFSRAFCAVARPIAVRVWAALGLTGEVSEGFLGLGQHFGHDDQGRQPRRVATAAPRSLPQARQPHLGAGNGSGRLAARSGLVPSP